MMPSREHFLLKRRNALSTFSFSPTLTVDIPLNPPSPQALFGTLWIFKLPVYYTSRKNFCQVFYPIFFQPFSAFFRLSGGRLYLVFFIKSRNEFFRSAGKETSFALFQKFEKTFYILFFYFSVGLFVFLNVPYNNLLDFFVSRAAVFVCYIFKLVQIIRGDFKRKLRVISCHMLYPIYALLVFST